MSQPPSVIPTPTNAKRPISASRLITLIERGLAEIGRPGTARLVSNPFPKVGWLGQRLLEVREETGHVLHHCIHGMEPTAAGKAARMVERHRCEKAIHPGVAAWTIRSANGHNPTGDWIAYASALNDSVKIMHQALLVDDVGREEWRILPLHPEGPTFGMPEDRKCWRMLEMSAERRTWRNLSAGIVISGMAYETTMALGGGFRTLNAMRDTIHGHYDYANRECDETTSVRAFTFSADDVPYAYAKGRLALGSMKREIGGTTVKAGDSGIKIPDVLSQTVALACAGRKLDDVVRGTPWGHIRIRSVSPGATGTLLRLDAEQVSLRAIEDGTGLGRAQIR
jgi:hypothetical protein